jgi:hypothetical protein
MSNVVPFPKRDHQSHAKVTTSPVYIELETVINTSSPLEEGDLVAWHFGTEISGMVVMFDYWFPPKGRECNGHFVAKGSPRECAYLGPMSYCLEDLQQGKFRILGKVCGAVPLCRFAPPAS